MISASSCCGIKSAATLGTFDGVHIGHRRILEKVITYASDNGLQSAVVTFDRHPASFLYPDKAPQLLTTTEEKLELLEETGIENVFIIEFTNQIANMSPDDFIQQYLVKCLGLCHFVVGYDHGFGKDRKGSAESLDRIAHLNGFSVEIQPPVTVNGVLVSSSAIRKCITDGAVDTADEMLGRDFSLTGKVVSGHGVGKTIGIPTANIEPSSHEKIVPRRGVYAGWIVFENIKREAVISLGPRLTFGDAVDSIEVHVPEFHGDFYGKNAKIGFTKRIRDMRKFNSTEELIIQIKKDIELMNHLIPL
jgi:riboflavin kinase/FMN adenylyltransferase